MDKKKREERREKEQGLRRREKKRLGRAVLFNLVKMRAFGREFLIAEQDGCFEGVIRMSIKIFSSSSSSPRIFLPPRQADDLYPVLEKRYLSFFFF